MKKIYICHTLYHLFITLCKINEKEENTISINEVLTLEDEKKIN